MKGVSSTLVMLEQIERRHELLTMKSDLALVDTRLSTVEKELVKRSEGGEGGKGGSRDKKKKKKQNILPDQTEEEILKELSNMIGMKKIKQHIHLYLATVNKRSKLIEILKIIADDPKHKKVRKRIKKALAEQPTLHMVLTGSPGTGKTTVARIIAKLLQCTWGENVDFKTLRLTNLKGQYIGESAHLVKKALKPRKGFKKIVVFIDEAYQLNCRGAHGKEDSFNQEIKAALCEEAEDNRDSKCIILAGYTDEMRDLLDSNPGLRTRFPNIFTCPDYNRKQLYKIGMLSLKRCGHSFTTGANKAFRDLISKGMNGRDVRNLVERLISVASAKTNAIDIEEIPHSELDSFVEGLLTITKKDVKSLKK